MMPARLFKSLDEPHLGPGLAMSRAVGDLDSSILGVIATPEVIEHAVQPDDRYLIMASDGVWEFLSNEEAVRHECAMSAPS